MNKPDHEKPAESKTHDLDELIAWGKTIISRVKKSAGLSWEEMKALPLDQKVRTTEAIEWQKAVEEHLRQNKGGELPLRYKTIWKVHAEEREARAEHEATRFAVTYQSIIDYLEDLGRLPTPEPAQILGNSVRRSALIAWQEKLNFLQEQEALASDRAQKFSIAKQIQEAKTKIREFGG